MTPIAKKVQSMTAANDDRAQKATSRRRRAGSGEPNVIREVSISWQGRALVIASRLTLRPILHLGTFIHSLPWPFGIVNTLARFVMVPPRGTSRTPVQLDNCNAEIVRADGVGPADGTGRVILYLHGGAFIACGPNTHARIVSTLSREVGAPVLSVDYRMAPKSPVNDAVQDSLDGYRWLIEHGYLPEQIAVAGDSAGGYLSFMVALSLIKEGQEPPAAIAALSPLTELAPAGKMNHPNVKTDGLFTARSFEALDQILKKTAKRVSVDGIVGPLVEPAAEDLSKMPPTMIHASSSEALLYDAELMANRLAAAHVPVELKIWEGQIHVFQAGESFVPEARQSLTELGKFVREQTATAGLSVAG